MYNMEISSKAIYILLISTISAAICLAYIINRQQIKHSHNRYISISQIDITILAFFTYALINIIFVREAPLQYETIAGITLSLIVYLICRNLRNQKIIINVLIIYAIFESLIAYLQAFGYITSNHRLFSITGTFGNPGQLGCILAIGISIAIYEFIYNRHALYRVFTMASMLFISGALFLSNSRASWIASIIGIYCILYPVLKKLIPRITLFAISTIIISGIFSVLYLYKKPSADGRLLIWKVTVKMIAESPIVGHGIGSFSNKYMYYQADYFKNNNTGPAETADNIIYPYNETLRIAAEMGVIGCVFIIAISFLIISLMKKYNYYNTIFAILYIVVFIYSLFSYPLSVACLYILYPAIIGAIKVNNNVNISIRPMSNICAAGAIILMINLYITYNHDVKVLSSNTINSYYKIRILQSPRFINSYSYTILADTNDIRKLEILRTAAQVSPSSDLFCDIGDYYYATKQLDKADSCYTLAHFMVPLRITPLYKRFVIAKTTHDIEKAKLIARKIVFGQYKIVSTRTIAMKHNAKEFLQLIEQ